MPDMKKNLLIVTAVITNLLCACSSDEAFLAEKPKTRYTIESAFVQSSQVDATLASAYRYTCLMFGWAYPNRPAALLGGIGSDCYDALNEICGWGQNGQSHFERWSTDDLTTERTWDILYQTISFANLTLRGAEMVKWNSNAEKEAATAQAHLIKGFAYLRLGECWGGVPLVTEIIDVVKDDYVRATREEIYNYAIEELKLAEAQISEYPAQDGRPGKGVCRHYLAEAYLALGVETGDDSCYATAVNYATKTIEAHPLMTSRFGVRADPSNTGTNNGVPNYKPDGDVYYDLFQIGNYDYSTGNTEALWVMQAMDYDTFQSTGLTEDHLYDNTLPYTCHAWSCGPVFRDIKWKEELQEPNANASPWNGDVDQEKYPGGYVCAYLGGSSIGRVAETFYLSDEIWAGAWEDDIRYNELNSPHHIVCVDRAHSRYGTVVTRDDIDPMFYYNLYPMHSKLIMQDGWGWHPSQEAEHIREYGRDWYMARSAETYLLRAEAYLKLGKKDLAANDINVIRTRANCAKKVTAAEVDIDLIFDERARELCYEEHRWPQLLRQGSSKNGGSNPVMQRRIKEHAMYVKDQPVSTGDIQWTLFPIPQVYIDMNTGAVLEQNPGWE